jgi:hypothetical protein
LLVPVAQTAVPFLLWKPHPQYTPSLWALLIDPFSSPIRLALQSAVIAALLSGRPHRPWLPALFGGFFWFVVDLCYMAFWMALNGPDLGGAMTVLLVEGGVGVALLFGAIYAVTTVIGAFLLRPRPLR